jgi:hypothetical protein
MYPLRPGSKKRHPGADGIRLHLRLQFGKGIQGRLDRVQRFGAHVDLAVVALAYPKWDLMGTKNVEKGSKKSLKSLVLICDDTDTLARKGI